MTTTTAAVVFTASRVRRFPVHSRFHKSAPPEWPLLKKAFIEMPSSRRRPSLIVVCLARHFPARDMGSFVSLLAPFSSPAPPSRRYRGNNGGAIITAAAHDKEGSSRPRLASFLSALVGRPLIGLKVYRNGCRNGYCCPLPCNRRRLGASGPTMAIGRKALVFLALGGGERRRLETARRRRRRHRRRCRCVLLRRRTAASSGTVQVSCGDRGFGVVSSGGRTRSQNSMSPLS